MSVVAFFLGLAIGLGFWLCWQAWLYKQLGQLLRSLPADTKFSPLTSSRNGAEIGRNLRAQVDGGGMAQPALPLISRLRRGILLADRYRQNLEIELETWQEFLQVAPCGFLIVDEENQLLWCNEQARQLLNLDRWEPGQIRLLLELVRSYELDQLIEQTRQRQQPCQQEWVFHPTYPNAQAVGGARSFTLRASSWPLPEGEVAVFLENRQALVELSQAQDRWVSDLAHELRTPLTSIRLVAEALQDRLQPPMSRWVERLLPEVNRLIDLVQDWLELSQLEVDSSNKLRRKPLELRSLIVSVWHSLEPLVVPKQLELSYSGPDSLWLEADESRLHRVFLNLLDNSIKYSPPLGEIRVEVNLLPKNDVAKLVEINIIDSGVGFPESDLPHVFERLYRGDASRTRQTASPLPEDEMPRSSSQASGILSTTGSGLGLAIVRQIVLAHGGSVQAKNHPQTGGAWLKIELPYEQAIAPQVSAEG
ncbi:histidine kinase [Planktothrix sp. FACHB-1355]|uniref:histidine kinase n=1 Tax=Aerosakkonema funiforme FACHB-1375 TaxID=2949571 RepID=A0A926ZGE7_9CYAN|nr:MULTISPECIES: ATP-binding protein [Oscillatoriales]MBD2179721.1 histidine kinase [Aerosakkonema funiforme FACHB-1375]MBD3558163.1 histidine kinase [Planktothrix sp. FACHB-1355]